MEVLQQLIESRETDPPHTPQSPHTYTPAQSERLGPHILNRHTVSKGVYFGKHHTLSPSKALQVRACGWDGVGFWCEGGRGERVAGIASESVCLCARKINR